MTYIAIAFILMLGTGFVLMVTEAYRATTLQCPKCGSWYIDDKHDQFFRCEDCGEQWL